MFSKVELGQGTASRLHERYCARIGDAILWKNPTDTVKNIAGQFKVNKVHFTPPTLAC